MTRRTMSALMMVLVAGGTLAAQTITLSKKTGSPTAALTVSGTGFAAKAAIDIYFDTTDEVLVIAGSTGAFTAAPVAVPASAIPGSHWISAIQRSTGTGAQAAFSVNTNWNQAHFGVRRRGSNPYENVLSPATVGNLDLTWNFPLGAYAGDPVVVNGVVYFSSDDHNVYAVSATTGAKIWSFATGNSVEGSPMIANGVAYIGSGDGALYALNATTGAKIWSYQTGGFITASPVVVNNIVLFGSHDQTFYALNAKTGAKIWSLATKGIILGSPAVAGSVVYFGSDDNNIYALNTATGAELWAYTTGNIVQDSATVGNGVVYIGSGDGNFYALNSTTGSTLWSMPLASNFSNAVFANNTVYVGANSTLYALSAFTGAILWSQPFGGFVESVSAANGVVYSSTAQTVYAFNSVNGSMLWSYTIGGPVNSSPTIANGQVFMGSFSTGVYCFSLPAPPVADSSKPPAPSSLHPDLNLKPWGGRRVAL
jgi:outer membrane protein assembly factor BamB